MSEPRDTRRSPWSRRQPVEDVQTPGLATDLHNELVASLQDRVALLEAALRSDRDLSIAIAPTDLANRPGPTCLVWDHTGRAVFTHHGEPALFVGPSVSATRLNAAIEVVKRKAESGVLNIEIVQIYGPPRRDMVVVGETLVDDGEQLGVAVRVIDISAQRKHDEARRDFVTNISHELRTPVGAIGVLAEMMTSAESPDVLLRLADRVDVEAARLSRMIDDLLQLAIAESSDPASDSHFEVFEAVEIALDRITPGAAAKNIVIKLVKGAAPQKLSVNGTSAELASALHNLLDNAVKYSPVGSIVEVHIDQPNGTEVCVSVVDHGEGIPSPDRARIFERFYRVDPARARGTGGTGLGLSIVRHLVSNLGGTVDVVSIEGHGSTFAIRLPIPTPQGSRPQGSLPTGSTQSLNGAIE